MTAIDRQLSLLFSRLEWPSGLVRERACVAIAALLLDERHGEATRNHLIRYLKYQPLESRVAVGLLPYLYALELNEARAAPYAEELVAAIGKRSILSWLLFREVQQELAGDLGAFLIHSGPASSAFTPSPFFENHVRAFLPPVYDLWARHIDEARGIRFSWQWAYEWHEILKGTGNNPSVEPLHFWVRERPSGERYHAVDMEMSEVYRSAFLRALAWAISGGALPQDYAVFLAARTCPIDLDLWHLPPGRRPVWWPTVKETEGTIEIAPAEIWHQVEELWRRQDRKDTSWLGEDWILAQASGLVHQGSTVYDLEISGLFQHCHGPNLPDLESIASWYRGEDKESDNQVRARCPSHLRFRGGVVYLPLSDAIKQFGDWSVASASGHTESYSTIPRWQYWRMYPKIWLPSPYVSETPITFRQDTNALVIRNFEETIGLWSDWTDGIGESLVGPLPPPTGQQLLLRRSHVERFAADTASTFCWVCRLTGYYREHTYRDYEVFTHCRAFGASGVVRV